MQDKIYSFIKLQICLKPFDNVQSYVALTRCMEHSLLNLFSFGKPSSVHAPPAYKD
jgi:hypothetical protein